MIFERCSGHYPKHFVNYAAIPNELDLELSYAFVLSNR
jgi:hypothetical protein